VTGERVERRLAAVLAADVAGYSRLMGRDEEGTLAGLKAVRKALVDPTIAAHRGRIVKTTGDGMLMEFASAVDATRCAIEVQRGMPAQNADVPQERKIEFRIGIHVATSSSMTTTFSAMASISPRGWRGLRSPAAFAFLMTRSAKSAARSSVPSRTWVRKP
jgi:class 3 adenylate cyclase